MRILTALALVCAAAAGCRPADPLARVVFVKADDLAVTAKDAKDAAEFLAAVRAGAGKPVKERERARWINRMAMRAVPSLVTSALLERELARRGVRASEAAVAAVLARYRASLRRPGATEGEIAEALGPLGAYFRRQFARECRLEQYLMECEGVEPTDEDVEIAAAQLRQVIARSEAENARAKARGEEAWKRLCAGEAWDAVAKAYSEDRLLYGEDCDYAHEWETVDPKYFYLPEIAEALPGMEAGAFTKPIETDEGLLIVRVRERTAEGQYRCARILIRLKVKMEQPERNILRRQLAKENREQAQLELLKDVRRGVTFEYPLGTNFTYRVVVEPAKAKGPARSDRKKRQDNRKSEKENGHEEKK